MTNFHTINHQLNNNNNIEDDYLVNNDDQIEEDINIFGGGGGADTDGDELYQVPSSGGIPLKVAFANSRRPFTPPFA